MITEAYLFSVIVFFLLINKKILRLKGKIQGKIIFSLTVLTVAFYLKMVIWRPNLVKVTYTNMAGNFYLPFTNLLAVGIVALLLLKITHNFYLSLVSGMFATVVWTPIMAIVTRLMAEVTSFPFWIFYFWLFAMELTFFVDYHTKNMQITVSNKLLNYTFGTYVGMLMLILIFPNLFFSNWLRIFTGGTSAYSQPPELAADIVLRTSGYLFWSLLVIRVFERKKK